MKPSQDPKLQVLLKQYANAMFDCGDHRKDYELPYDVFHARGKEAERQLLEYVDQLAEQGDDS